MIDTNINFKEVEELNREDANEELEEEEDENTDEDENNIKISNKINNKALLFSMPKFFGYKNLFLEISHLSIIKII